MGQIQIRRATRGDSAALGDFWDEVKRAERGVSFPAGLDAIAWRFDNPFGQNGGSVWVAEDQARIIGHLAASPCPFYHNGERVEAVWWQDFYVTKGANGESRRPVGALLASRLRSEPCAQAVVGTPGLDTPVARLYQRLGFLCRGAVPFYFLINHSRRVLEGLAYLRSNRVLGAISSLCAHLLIPGAALSPLARMTGRRRLDALARACSIRETNQWGSEAGDLWERARPKFHWICDRSPRYLNWRYKSDAYRRFQVYGRNGSYLGWVVCKVRQMYGNPYFGALRIGTIVDVLADPAEPEAIASALAAGTSRLAEAEVDMTICNLSDRRYRSVVQKLGFWRGPSSFILFTRGLEGARVASWHLTRGDSDGDYNL